MPRGIIIVLDSFGCGGAADAGAYGDAGADTLGHIAIACAAGKANRHGLRHGDLRLPNLDALGLGLAAEASTGMLPPGLSRNANVSSGWGYGVETAQGKDTPSGHWEIAGAPALTAFGTFPETDPCFPESLMHDLMEKGHVPGLLGNVHASGARIIEEFGETHIRTGKPICYTSADSVFQIAAHESAFGLERLYEFCRVARKLCDPLNIGRIIARPFVGIDKASFRRTYNRKDFAVPPPQNNLLQRLSEAGRSIISVGKIGDIFAHRFTGEEVKGSDNNSHIDLTLAAQDRLSDGGLLFVNLVDFDTDFGHRRDVCGYAACLESFDRRVPEILARLRSDDLLVFTADHGNDPTWKGSDHTREHVPILSICPNRRGVTFGRRNSLSDIAATMSAHLNVRLPQQGVSWI